MNNKLFTKFASLAVLFLFTFGGISAQTFPGNTTNTAGNTLIPSSGTGSCFSFPQTAGGTIFNNDVAGVDPAAPVESVLINLNHTWCSDLDIYLEAPNGEILELTSDNGGSGDNFTNTNFIDGAPSITGGAAPFTGDFAPEGGLGSSTCGTTITPTVSTMAGFTPGQNGTWRLVIKDDAGGDTGNMISWSITFAEPVEPPQPGEPCEIVCPGNIIVELDPGACEAIVNWNDPTTTGDCGISIMEPGQITQNLNTTAVDDALSCFAGDRHFRAYDLVEEGVTDDFEMTGLRMSSWNGGTMQIFVYTYTGALGGGTLPLAEMTLIGQSDPTPVVGNGPNDVQYTIPLTAPVTIPAGTKFAVEQRGTGNLFTIAANYAGQTRPAYFICGGPTDPQSYNNFGFGFLHNIQICEGNFVVDGAPVPVQTSGPESGSIFPRGTETICYDLVDPLTDEVIDDCCFDVTVNEYYDPITTLACNDNIQVSVNENCEALITTDMMLEGGPYGCYDDYLVEVEGYGSGFGGVTIDNSAIGSTLTVTVISVEDKIDPVIECRDMTIMCGAQLPDVPAPAIVGYQELVITGLEDVVDNNEFEYEFDFGYLPSTPVLDVDVRIKIDDHTWLPDVNIDVESPDGTVIQVFDVGGCFGQEFPINCVWDDDGAAITQCVDLDAGDDGRLQPLINGGFSMPALFDFNGLDASGVWKVRIVDGFAGDDGTIREVGLYINVNLPQVDPTDNCGEVELSYTDTESGDPCEGGLIVTRHWVATDESGNTSECDQVVTVEPLVLDSVVCPPAYVGSCGESSHPDNTGWPTVNGDEITH